MSILSIRSEGVSEYLARTCADWSEEAIPERDPGYRLPGCELPTWAELSAEHCRETCGL